MSVFKCKMCGGDLIVSEGMTVAECEYCGTSQTVPSGDSEKTINLFNRANKLRIDSEFDKAAALYEQIIAEFPKEAEAYWCLCLCNYGIEYVDDPATARKVPTVHRASFKKLSNDDNYKLACEYADMSARIYYQDEARAIDRIMDEILTISSSEKPYDVFICYKETDNYGNRTPDSVIAQDVYNALTDKGYKVFFSRITLEDKLGMQYEPYIFAALNSAKIMLAIGTDYEYFNAAWVKNEWSRFLKLAAADKSKVLIPCFKNIDAYDLPNEFKMLQAQDMGKLGWMQDLIRGVEKLLVFKDKEKKKIKLTVSAKDKEAIEEIESSILRGDWGIALQKIDKGILKDGKCAELWELKIEAISIRAKDENYKTSYMKDLSLSVKNIEKLIGKNTEFYSLLNDIYEPVLKGYINKYQQELLESSNIFGKGWENLPYETEYKKSASKVKEVYEKFYDFCDYLYPSQNALNIITPLYDDLNGKSQILCDRVKVVKSTYKNEYQQYCDYVISKISSARNKINDLFPEHFSATGKLYVIGFSKTKPLNSKVFIRINGIQVGEVERGEVFEYDINNFSRVDLKYVGDFFWKESVAVINPGDVVTLKLNYGFTNHIEAKTNEKPSDNTINTGNSFVQPWEINQQSVTKTTPEINVESVDLDSDNSGNTAMTDKSAKIFIIITLILSVTPFGLIMSILGIILFKGKRQKKYRNICIGITIAAVVLYALLCFLV